MKSKRTHFLHYFDTKSLEIVRHGAAVFIAFQAELLYPHNTTTVTSAVCSKLLLGVSFIFTLNTPGTTNINGELNKLLSG